jgi:hypothetical protein
VLYGAGITRLHDRDHCFSFSFSFWHITLFVDVIAVWHFLSGKSSPSPSNFSRLINLKQLNPNLRTVNAIIAVGMLTRQRAGVRIQAGTGDISLLQGVKERIHRSRAYFAG